MPASTRLASRLKCSSLKLGHRNRDLCLQLANPTAQLADSALRAHTAIRARLNDRPTLWATLNHGRTRDPEMDDLEPPHHQPALQPDLIEVEEKFALPRRRQGLLVGRPARPLFAVGLVEPLAVVGVPIRRQNLDLTM